MDWYFFRAFLATVVALLRTFFAAVLTLRPLVWRGDFFFFVAMAFLSPWKHSSATAFPFRFPGI
jgi:hypothetical protein